jgi:uracil-DNA glycosylase
MTLDEIYKKVNECKNCELCKNRIVPYNYRGKPESKVIFIGEAPGEEEQKQGKPFVGRCGKLLDKILLEININPERDVYITNIVKCRPPNNRAPLQHEIIACQNYLIEEMRTIKPKLIVTLGRTPGFWWNKNEGFDWLVYNSEKLWLALYHPSYLLRRRDLIPNCKEALLKIWQ